MTRATPWGTLDECIVVLRQRRDVLSRQIDDLNALRLKTDDRDVQLVLRYLVVGSTKGAAEWANEQGWRLPGAKDNDRKYTAKDITGILDNPPEGVGRDLISLVLNIFNANDKQVNRSYG